MKLEPPLAAIVTGGASGLGEATARMLSAHGVRVALFDMNAAKGVCHGPVDNFITNDFRVGNDDFNSIIGAKDGTSDVDFGDIS